MTVYIEYVILDNFIFTLLICALSYSLLRERVRKGRCLVSSGVGTCCALVYPFVKNAILVIVFKITLYFVMCLILYLRLSKFFTRAAVFLLSTAIMGGVQFMLGFAVYGNAYDALRLPVSDLPLSLFFGVPFVFALIIKRIFRSINAHRLRQNFIYEFKLTICERCFVLRGLIDTGNSAKADKAVVFINSVTAFELLGGDFVRILAKDEASSISIHTAAGDKKIMLIPAKIELYSGKDEHIFMDVQVGISDVRTNGEYEAILPLSILGKEKVL